MAMGKTFFFFSSAPAHPLPQFGAVDKLTDLTPGASLCGSTFQLILCLLTWPTAALIVVSFAHRPTVGK